MTPDFYRFICSTTPLEHRKGCVFHVGNRKSNMTSRKIGDKIAAIGREAGVIVDAESGKCASCHDLRRSFGSRWARKVMPLVLKSLMRHHSLDTTLRFYVSLDAADTAGELWDKFGSQTGFNETSDETSAISPLVMEQGSESQPPLQPTYKG